ncbi:hypothetical protein J416_11597 [Gracilibacillus halophilus YIM-C55.5]|uniref:Uncharacterized protein n=1 Tax=Gracilibacillus halophilus YIM-C55.5 TaxID=1308866 RepID=N4W7P4_9BACI|nr:hypothetical protein [Gracilibacillus halophilus]ENH96293.1 hypothetical protein J416_11597 [Gracilibacillus halophilus YIM-C55.5]
MVKHIRTNNVLVKQFLQADEELPLYVLAQQLGDHLHSVADMRQACIACRNEDNQLIAMEYLYLNGYLQDVHDMIEKNKQSNRLRNQRWAMFYQMLYERRMRPKKERKRDKPIRFLDALGRMDILITIIHYKCYMRCFIFIVILTCINMAKSVHLMNE